MNRAKQLRLDRGLGLVDVADGAGISHNTLRKIEAGTDVNVQPLARLATFYRVRASELLQPAIFETNGEAA